MHNDSGGFGGRFGMAYVGFHAKATQKVHAKFHMPLKPHQTHACVPSIRKQAYDTMQSKNAMLIQWD